MLASHIAKGTVIRGLAQLLDGGGVVGGNAGQINRGINGSYTVNGAAIDFFADATGANPVNILPYVAGAISYTQMQGKETISGEFTGCTMAIYNDSGTTRICHVDTAKPSSGDAPSKTLWGQMKSKSGFEMADELATTGMIGKFLDSNAPDSSFATLSILGIASPVVGISSFYVTKKSGVYTVVGVG